MLQYYEKILDPRDVGPWHDKSLELFHSCPAIDNNCFQLFP